MSRLFFCKINPNYFCYVCGQYIIAKNGNTITDNFKLNVEIKRHTPHIFCRSCSTLLYRWSNGEKAYLSFKKPMIWREPFDHMTDCYFCVTNVTGINSKNKHTIKYAEVLSVTKPVSRDRNEEGPVPPGLSSSNSSQPSVEIQNCGSSFSAFENSEEQHLITQCELNDLIRDLNLPIHKSELLAFTTTTMEPFG